MKYLLVGGSGGPNYGDELMLRGWMEYLNGTYPNIDLRAEVNIKRNADSFHENQNCTFSEDFKKLAKRNSELTFWQQVSRGFYFFERNGATNNKDIDLTYLSSLDILHLHGGGYINENAPLNGFILGFSAAIKKEYNVKLIATGIGLMPISAPSQEFQIETANKVFSLFDGFEVRDHESFIYLKNFLKISSNIHKGVDDSFILDKRSLLDADYDVSSSTLYLSYAEYNFDKFSDSYWEELKSYSQGFDRIVFWECFPWKDKNVFEKLKVKFPTLDILTAKQATYIGKKLSGTDCLITSRFHPHLISARLGLKGIYYTDSKYYDVKHTSVLASGSSFSKGSYSDFIAPTNDCKQLSSYISENLTNLKIITYNYMLKG